MPFCSVVSEHTRSHSCDLPAPFQHLPIPVLHCSGFHPASVNCIFRHCLRSKTHSYSCDLPVLFRHLPIPVWCRSGFHLASVNCIVRRCLRSGTCRCYIHHLHKNKVRFAFSIASVLWSSSRKRCRANQLRRHKQWLLTFFHSFWLLPSLTPSSISVFHMLTYFSFCKLLIIKEIKPIFIDFHTFHSFKCTWSIRIRSIPYLPYNNGLFTFYGIKMAVHCTYSYSALLNSMVEALPGICGTRFCFTHCKLLKSVPTTLDVLPHFSNDALTQFVFETADWWTYVRLLVACHLKVTLASRVYLVFVSLLKRLRPFVIELACVQLLLIWCKKMRSKCVSHARMLILGGIVSCANSSPGCAIAAEELLNRKLNP